MHLRLNVAALAAVVNGFRALLKRKGEQQTNGDRRYMNGKTFPGMNWFVRSMGFEHGCRCIRSVSRDREHIGSECTRRLDWRIVAQCFVHPTFPSH
jgi:hypothetical protein